MSCTSLSCTVKSINFSVCGSRTATDPCVTLIIALRAMFSSIVKIHITATVTTIIGRNVKDLSLPPNKR